MSNHKKNDSHDADHPTAADGLSDSKGDGYIFGGISKVNSAEIMGIVSLLLFPRIARTACSPCGGDGGGDGGGGGDGDGGVGYGPCGWDGGGGYGPCGYPCG